MDGEPKSDALRSLYWRDEILKVLFWREGEGLGERADVRTVSRFLGSDPRIVGQYMDGLAADGLLSVDEAGIYRVTPRGREYGARILNDEDFASVVRPQPGACGDECWCLAGVEEAVACMEDRQ